MTVLPKIDTPDFVDAIERLVLARDSPIASGDLVSALIAHAGIEDDESVNMAEIREAASIAVDEMLSIIERRERTVGDTYPLRANNGALEPREGWKGGNAYIFLRLMRYNQNPPNSIREAFETTAASAVAQFFRARMIRTGAPQRHPVPSSPREMVAYVAGQIGDGRGPKSIDYPDSGDLSIDAFVFHLFDEPNEDDPVFVSQRLILVVNCATGKTWLDLNKPFEPIVENAKQYWENFVSPVWPVFCIPDFEVSVYARQQIGNINALLFGGWRISKWSRHVPDDAREWVASELGNVSHELAELPFTPA